MEMKYVVPDMAQSFGTLEFAGESEPIFERDKNNRRVLADEAITFILTYRKAKMWWWKFPCRLAKRSSNMNRK